MDREKRISPKKMINLLHSAFAFESAFFIYPGNCLKYIVILVSSQAR